MSDRGRARIGTEVGVGVRISCGVGATNVADGRVVILDIAGAKLLWGSNPPVCVANSEVILVKFLRKETWEKREKCKAFRPLRVWS